MSHFLTFICARLQACGHAGHARHAWTLGMLGMHGTLPSCAINMPPHSHFYSHTHHTLLLSQTHTHPTLLISHFSSYGAAASPPTSRWRYPGPRAGGAAANHTGVDGGPFRVPSCDTRRWHEGAPRGVQLAGVQQDPQRRSEARYRSLASSPQRAPACGGEKSSIIVCNMNN